jgi:hypothetical protein
MDESDSSNTIFMSGPAGLARILDQNQQEAPLWEPAEMRAMWQHQLSVPLDVDLGTVQSANLSALRKGAEASFLEKGFQDLLHNPKPPLQLLKLTKNFAKQTLKEAEDPQFREIAAALYYASYAAAMLHHSQRLGAMNRHELAGGFEWALARVWLDEPTKKLISDARDLLKK